MKPQVTIIIPTFNRADFLENCILSCLAQTIGCEIIVCDHGSTDETPQVAEKYKPSIKYIRREIDSGVHFCWLDGVISAQNDLIHLNFDDDWIEPTFIEECLALFNEEVGCVFSNAKLYYNDSKSFSNGILFNNLETNIYNSKILRNFSLNDLASPGAAIFRKEVILDTLFQGKIPFTINNYKGVGPDLLFSLESTFRYKKFGYINKNLAIFRHHSGSITIDASKNMVKQELINKAYDDARIYFLISVFIEKSKIYKLIYRILKIIKK
jgi:glycosyltransferase involved in cell wall biosynthesis